MSVAGRNLWLVVGGVFCFLAFLGAVGFLVSVAR
jgi:hypothetical protein